MRKTFLPAGGPILMNHGLTADTTDSHIGNSSAAGGHALRRTVPHRRPLEKSLFIRLLLIALVCHITPYLQETLHGLVGFLPLVGAALAIGVAQGRLGEIGGNIYRAAAANKALLLLYSWYAIGLSVNYLIRGGGDVDWRLIVGPIVDFGVILLILGVNGNSKAARQAEILFILVWGLQCALMLWGVLANHVILRDEIILGGGATIYGNQGAFAGLAMVLPAMAWRAFDEKGALRLLLVASLGLGLASLVFSSFATPIALVGIGACLIVVLLPFVSRKAKIRYRLLILAGLAAVLFLGYTVIVKSPLLGGVRSRFENEYYDPTSGGYTGQSRDLSRWTLAHISGDSFLEAPLFGVGGGTVRSSELSGGHSSLLDGLAIFGLLGGGGALAGLILVLVVRSGLLFFRVRSWLSLMCLTSVSLLVVGGVTNPYWEGGQILMVLWMGAPLLWRQYPAASTNP